MLYTTGIAFDTSFAAKPRENSPSNLFGVRLMQNLFTTVIFTAKPVISGFLAPGLAQHYDPRTTLVAHLLLAGPARFDYPRGLPLSAYPVITAPAYRLEREHAWMASALEHLVHSSASNTPAVRISNDFALEAIRGAKTFVFAGDPCPSSIHAFRGTMALLRPDLDPHAEYSAYVFNDFSQPVLMRAVAAPTTTADFAALAEQCVVKRYFEWNWNLNAVVLFGRALRAAGAPEGATVSKFGLQALYFLDAQRGMTEGALIGQMQRWTGTGKYKPEPMGSAASRGAIFEQLHEAGLISDGHVRHVTWVGQQLLRLLHPGCKDADLPARLDVWMQEGLATAQPAMDRYLRTVFGRQARFKPGTM